ncbi:MAG: hypothetical protein IIA30_11845 [Myxococcales bacterium]|nr:hypothetical protein [Myxococcales bacterium]MCH8133234.1 hypothetical protein [Myxococcales bacterium]
MASRTRVDEVLRFLGLEESPILEQLRREGLFEEEWLEGEASEELRVAASLIRELGVNPAGVEVVLHMRRRMLALEDMMERSLRKLLAELEP